MVTQGHEDAAAGHGHTSGMRHGLIQVLSAFIRNIDHEQVSLSKAVSSSVYIHKKGGLLIIVELICVI